MELVGQMYKLSACFDTPSEYKGLPYDYFPDEAVSYGSTICSFGLPYNDHNYGMPVGLTPPVMAPHLMDPVPKPKKPSNSINPQWTRMESKSELMLEDVAMIKTESDIPNLNEFNLSTNNNCTPRKQYLDENDYPVYVEPEIKVVEVPSNMCVSPSEYSECTTDSSDDDDVGYNPDFIAYLKQVPKKHESVEKYLNKAKSKLERYAASQKSSGSERREVNPTVDFVIDCICEFNYDDKRMVQCESCGVRQHIDCMYTNPRQVQNFLKHRCHKCSDISVDVSRAKAIQQSRKNWHSTADRIAGHKINRYIRADDTVRRPREFMVNFREIRTDRKHSDGSRSHRSSNHHHHLNAFRVNKRKQDLKACLEVNPGSKMGAATGGTGSSSVSSGDSNDQDLGDHNSPSIKEHIPVEAGDSSVIDSTIHQPQPSTTVQESSQHEETNNIPPTGGNERSTNHSIYHRRTHPTKKDYKEATKSLYSTKLLDKVQQMSQSESEQQSQNEAAAAVAASSQNSNNVVSNNPLVGDQGSEFLDRNPRCRIVIFDSMTRGIEASVKIQGGSIVTALIGKMMLMDEYLACTNPISEFRPYVFLYHSFGDIGIAIDCTNYGNITRYLRRSCDPNVKLEHMIVGGVLYVVIRTITEVYQGVELTMAFDVPFELCQYPVQCACGKVRCPAIKHRRKHHRSRVIPSNINCEQVIEDKLRELSQPILSNSPNSSPQHPNTSGANLSGSSSVSQSPLKFGGTPNKNLSSMVLPRFGIVSRPSITACLEYARSNKRLNAAAAASGHVSSNSFTSNLARRLFSTVTPRKTPIFSMESSSDVGSTPDKRADILDNNTQSSSDVIETPKSSLSKYTPDKHEEPISLVFDGIKKEQMEPIIQEEDEEEPQVISKESYEIKLEASVPTQIDQNNDSDEEAAESDDSVKTTPSKQVEPLPSQPPLLTSNPVILLSKRQPKPKIHPDFEMDFDMFRNYSTNRTTLNKSRVTNKMTSKKDNRHSVRTNLEANVMIKTEPSEPPEPTNQNEGSFKSIITTRRQKKHDRNTESIGASKSSNNNNKSKVKK